MLFLTLFYKTIGRNYFLSSEINSKLLLILFLRFCCRLCCMRYIGICWRFLRKNFKRLRTSIVMDAQYPNVFVYNTNEFTGRLYTGVILVFLYLPPHWSHNYLLIKKFDSYCIRFRFFHFWVRLQTFYKKKLKSMGDTGRHGGMRKECPIIIFYEEIIVGAWPNDEWRV